MKSVILTTLSIMALANVQAARAEPSPIWDQVHAVCVEGIKSALHDGDWHPVPISKLPTPNSNIFQITLSSATIGRTRLGSVVVIFGRAKYIGASDTGVRPMGFCQFVFKDEYRNAIYNAVNWAAVKPYLKQNSNNTTAISYVFSGLKGTHAVIPAAEVEKQFSTDMATDLVVGEDRTQKVISIGLIGPEIYHNTTN